MRTGQGVPSPQRSSILRDVLVGVVGGVLGNAVYSLIRRSPSAALCLLLLFSDRVSNAPPTRGTEPRGGIVLLEEEGHSVTSTAPPFTEPKPPEVAKLPEVAKPPEVANPTSADGTESRTNVWLTRHHVQGPNPLTVPAISPKLPPESTVVKASSSTFFVPTHVDVVNHPGPITPLVKSPTIAAPGRVSETEIAVAVKSVSTCDEAMCIVFEVTSNGASGNSVTELQIKYSAAWNGLPGTLLELDAGLDNSKLDISAGNLMNREQVNVALQPVFTINVASSTLTLRVTDLEGANLPDDYFSKLTFTIVLLSGNLVNADSMQEGSGLAPFDDIRCSISQSCYPPPP